MTQIELNREPELLYKNVFTFLNSNRLLGCFFPILELIFFMIKTRDNTDMLGKKLSGLGLKCFQITFGSIEEFVTL